jgi:hypothetical protein
MLNRRTPRGAAPGLWARAADVTWSKQFAGLLRPPTADETAHMEATLLREGCPETFYVWAQGRLHLLLTGYAWLPLLRRHRVPFRVIPKEFAAFAEAHLFVVRQLLAGQSLSPLEVSYLRGLRYREEKPPHGGDRRSAAAREGAGGAGLTAEAMAEALGVTARTLRADAEFARAVDQVVAHCGERAKGLLLAPGAPLGREAVLRLAERNPDWLRRMFGAWHITGKPPAGLRRAGPTVSITLPRAPQPFAETLWRRAGPEGFDLYLQALLEVATRPGQGPGLAP